MEKEQHALNKFVQVHARKIKIKDERCIHLVEYDENKLPIDVTLQCYTAEDVLAQFDTSSKLIQWILSQVNTYDVKKEVVAGLIFSKSNVLAHVVCLRPD